jgi:hypothetical protein
MTFVYVKMMKLCREKKRGKEGLQLTLSSLHPHVVVHSKLRSITLCGNQSARDITEFCSVNMDA